MEAFALIPMKFIYDHLENEKEGRITIEDSGVVEFTTTQFLKIMPELIDLYNYVKEMK